jgi:threonine dehydratase
LRRTSPRSCCRPGAPRLIPRVDVEIAARRLAPYVLRTPLRHSDWLSSIAAAPVAIKLETLQHTFSFKFRGAMNAVLRLMESAGRPPALVTASAGNHGRGLAFAAAKVGLPLTVYVPANAPKVKIDAIVALGARVEPCRDYDEAERRAKAHDQDAALYVSPYSHPFVIEGAGTIGLEILEQDPRIEQIVCPVGGGGLVSGIAIAAGTDASTWGVETEASCPFTQGLAAGRIVPIDVGPSLADGLVGNLDPDTITFDLVRRHVAGIATVAEDAVAGAIGQLVREERLIAEGAAAVAVAGLVTGRVPLAGKRTAVVLTGANIDPDKLRQLI